MIQRVKDKGAEIGISLSIIIQACILGGIYWFGNYITSGIDDLNQNIVILTAELAELNTVTKLNDSKISNNTERINRNSIAIKDNTIKLDDFVQYYRGK